MAVQAFVLFETHVEYLLQKCYMWQKLCHLSIIVIKLRFFHFDHYLTWGNLAVFQTGQTHAQLFFYTHQYFQVYPQLLSTSITQQTTACQHGGI